MRDLTGTTLGADQLAMGDAKLKITLGKTGEVAKVYYIDSGDDRITDTRHIEQEWSQIGQVVLQDSDATLSALDLHGWVGYMGYGYGANYSEAAPMEVIAQTTSSRSGRIVTSLGMAGVFDMMGEDHASEDYSPEDTNGDTVKVILTAIVTATMACFSHTKVYIITFDTGYDAGDNLINTVIPADYFSVSAGETRLSAFKKALAFCGCKARIEYDGEVHIFVPEATTPEYVYDDVVTGHNFYEKSVRKRLTIPNKVIVSSHPDHEVQYTGTATDNASYTALLRYITDYRYIRATGNQQCQDIAEAMIKNYQLDAERGHGFAPMNCGQEVFDYVNIVDSKVGDERAGNIGYINREYSQGRFTMEFRFGKPSVGGVARPAFATEGTVSYNDLLAVIDYVNERVLDLARWFIDLREVMPKLHVEKQLIIPVVIPGAPIVSSQAVSDVLATTATGNGNITDLGVPNPTAHGVCYNTTGDPSISDTVTDEGVTSATGTYTTSITGLTADTKYYVRAYATNTTGTGYGIQVTFTTEAA